MLPRFGAVFIGPILLFLFGLDARSEVEVSWGGKLQSDIRFRIQKKEMGQFYNHLELPVGIARNENLVKGKLALSSGRFTGVLDVDFVWIGYPDSIDGVSDLALRQKVDPYRLQAHAAYVEASDLFVEGLDVRIGQQLVMWGKADQFNPTNTINASSLEDVLLFGDQLANLMARIDYSTRWDWTFSGVLIPIFKPALLPHSAPLALAAADRIPFVSEELRYRLHSEKALAQTLLGYPTVVEEAIPVLPEKSLENMQFALRVAGTLAEHDIAISYYNGRTDFPKPFLNYSWQSPDYQCNPIDPTDCIQGTLKTEVSLGYPRVQVVGLNMAGQINPFGWMSSKIKPLGYRLEMGLFLPQAASLILLQEAVDFGGIGGKLAGEYEPGLRPLVVDSTPFLKWTVGLDYTFNQYLYMNVQWVHGFVDEFGAGDWIHEGWSVQEGGVTTDSLHTWQCFKEKDGQKCARELLRPRLGDYLVLGLDLKLLQDKLLLRLFTIWDLIGIYEEKYNAQTQRRERDHYSMFTEEGFSAIIYPELLYNFGEGFELGAGVLMELGKNHTKFGDPATGGSLFWTRARYSF